MKTKTLLFIFLLTFGYVSAQTVERTIEGTTYVCDSLLRIVENKSNVISEKDIFSECHPNFKGTAPLLDIYRKVFSEKRAKELYVADDDRFILLCCFCDGTGKILEIRFHLLKKYSTIFLSEIMALENLLK